MAGKHSVPMELYDFAQVDAFAAVAFAGNPAAVCLLPAPADPDWMAAVGRETALPATAFIHAEDGKGVFGLRWFTATTELELCGHGTLASAHVLYETGHVDAGEAVRFRTKSGELTASRRDGWIELDFPATPDAEMPVPPTLAAALGISARDILYAGRSRLDCVVEVRDETIVKGLEPDLNRLREIKGRGVIVTSRSTSAKRDFVSRFFAPSTGIPEDSVTGSAHCCLAPFWARRLRKTTFVAHQLSARGGELRLALDGDRVRIGGQAVTVIRGHLTAQPR